VLGPSLAAVYFSLTDWSGYRPGPLGSALDNYLELAGDPEFGTAPVAQTSCGPRSSSWCPWRWGLFGAFRADPDPAGPAAAAGRPTSCPYIVASVVTSAIWKNLLSPDLGIGRMLHVNVLGNIHLALPGVEIVNNWAWVGLSRRRLPGRDAGTSTRASTRRRAPGRRPARSASFWHVHPAEHPTHVSCSSG